MKKVFYVLVLATGLASCSNNSESVESISVDSTAVDCCGDTTMFTDSMVDDSAIAE
tara:strand:+ start:404 stop:571 length:168 start_codon:yes stop_codon:yes gene_type:complete